MGYDCMVLVKDNTISTVEVFLELVVYLEGLWELMLEFGEARLSDSYQLCISWVMFLSLAVASRTLFYVMSMVCSVGEVDHQGGSLVEVCMVNAGHKGGSGGAGRGWVSRRTCARTSSGKIIISAGPVRWQEIVSVAFCHVPGM